MLNKLLEMLRRYDMVQPGDQVTCAVSGGPDSMALLWAMYLLGPKLGIIVAAAHFNHHLREQESDRDEAFVRDFCGRYDIPLYVGGDQVLPGEKGLEAAAREARYGFLETVPGKIATAHTADDNAETVLLHLVRGTGLKGLGAIAPVRGRVIRPMLLATREQVMAFLGEYHLSYVRDSSNDTDQFLRNRLRHQVMPLLTAENPRLAENLSAMALRLREDEEALTRLAQAESPLRVDRLRAMSGAQRSRVIAQFLENSGVKEPDAAHIALAERLVFSENPSAFASFPGGVTVGRCYQTLTVSHKPEPMTAAELSCPGTAVLPDAGIRAECIPSQRIHNSPFAFTVRPVGTVVLRHREPGDEMRLAGGTKSLKKLFIDRKIPASQRLLIPVASDEKGVLGVYGVGANLDRLEAGVEIRFAEMVDFSGSC